MLDKTFCVMVSERSVVVLLMLFSRGITLSSDKKYIKAKKRYLPCVYSKLVHIVSLYPTCHLLFSDKWKIRTSWVFPFGLGKEVEVNKRVSPLRLSPVKVIIA